MRILCICLILFILPIMTVSATEATAPPVPEFAEEYMPEDTQSFAKGLWYVVKAGIYKLSPSLKEAFGLYLSLTAVAILCGIMRNVSQTGTKSVDFAAAVAVSLLLVKPSGALVSLGAETVSELTDYGKLILPTLTAALAAQGGVTTSAALYAGTALFSSILAGCIRSLLIPLLWIYLCLGIASGMLSEEMLLNLKNFVKWVITWTLKIILYVFTGYMTITGVVSGSADAAAIKATKLTISGFVPVVGGIISDASEALLVSAGLVKSSIGIYGMLAVCAMFIGPFISIGIQYILLKVCCAVCKVLGAQNANKIMADFSKGMGMVLAMVATTTLLLVISTFCFMRGVL